MDKTNTTYDVEDNSHGLSGYTQTYVRGGVSSTWGPNSKTWFSYDEQGRSTWTIKAVYGMNNGSVKYFTEDYVYDSEGKIIKSIFQKNTPAETFVHYYEYDADGRLSKAYTNTTDNSTTKILQARYEYFLHGPVKRVEIGGNLQGIDYTYTLDGKLKAVNHSDKTKDPGQDGVAGKPHAGFLADAFGEVLEYYNGDYQANTSFPGGGGTQPGVAIPNATYSEEQYGGQIRGMSWFSKKPANAGVAETPNMYVYRYDNKYQFSDATWGTVSSNSFSAQPGVNSEAIGGYDKHGNIKSLTRKNSAAAVTDQFSYNYISTPKPTNRLGSITQLTTNQIYATYQYDALGQLTAEIPGPAYGTAPAKYIAYNVSGLVTAVFSDADTIHPLVRYVYDEGGARIKKTSYNSSGAIIKTTYYIGGVVYEQQTGQTTAVQTEVPVDAGGRVGIYFRQSNAYRYEMQDHLGNVRAVFVKTSTGTTDMVVFRDYYPFGMEIPGRNQTDADGYRYGFQGKYAEKDPETGWNAFELRMYDSRVGRWLSIDPAGQYASPYVGMGNDPANRTDPDGGWDWGKDKETGKWVYTKDDLTEGNFASKGFTDFRNDGAVIYGRFPGRESGNIYLGVGEAHYINEPPSMAFIPTPTPITIPNLSPTFVNTPNPIPGWYLGAPAAITAAAPGILLALFTVMPLYESPRPTCECPINFNDKYKPFVGHGNRKDNSNPHIVYEIFYTPPIGKSPTLKYGVSDLERYGLDRPELQLAALRSEFPGRNVNFKVIEIVTNRDIALARELKHVTVHTIVWGAKPIKQIRP